MSRSAQLRELVQIVRQDNGSVFGASDDAVPLGASNSSRSADSSPANKKPPTDCEVFVGRLAELYRGVIATGKADAINRLGNVLFTNRSNSALNLEKARFSGFRGELVGNPENGSYQGGHVTRHIFGHAGLTLITPFQSTLPSRVVGLTDSLQYAADVGSPAYRPHETTK